MIQRLGDTDKRTDNRWDKTAIIQILLDTKPEHHLLRKSVFANLSERLDIPVSQVYRILGLIRYAAQEIAETDSVINKYGGDKAALIQILLDIQQEKGWLPKSVLTCVSHRLGVPLNQICQITTFYKAFSLIPRGRHIISVCLGTSCQTHGSPRLLDTVRQVLKIEPGQTSTDMRFSLDAQSCLGCCAIGPVMVVDGTYYSQPSTQEMEEIFAACP